MKIANKVRGDSAMTFEFANANQLVCRLDELSPEMIQRLAVHGLSQKVGDSYASAATVEDAIERANDTWNMLVDGEWSVGRESSGGILAEALQRASGKTLEECQQILKVMPEADRKELKKHPGIAVKLADITAERAMAKADKLANKPVDMDKLTALFS